MDGSFSEERTRLFALVSYMPEPLAGFVDALRDELAPGCRLRAHITILPPRELGCGTAAASQELQKIIAQARSFRVSLGEVKVFKGSEVIHLAVEDGMDAFRELHARLTQGVCGAPELWGYQPHVTLAQDLEPAAVSSAFELAVRRWREYSGPRSFALDQLTFVRRTLENEETASRDGCWVDLKTWELPSAVLV
jgi:2'-5' RNA ligase